MEEISMTEITEDIPSKFEGKFSKLNLFFLSIFCFTIGFTCSTIFLVRYVDSERQKSYDAMAVALDHEKIALDLADKYKFTTEKIGILLQNRCVRDNNK